MVHYFMDEEAPPQPCRATLQLYHHERRRLHVGGSLRKAIRLRSVSDTGATLSFHSHDQERYSVLQNKNISFHDSGDTRGVKAVASHSFSHAEYS